MLQTVVSLIYPHHCATCEMPVARQGGQCGSCWRETPFIDGTVCDKCGAPVPGAVDVDLICDDCLVNVRPWDRGRAAVLYRERGRRVVLQIKHSDRLDLVPAAASWMAARMVDLVRDDTIVVPVPSHWRRLLKRRFNQAALLSRAVSRLLDLDHEPRALVRIRATPAQEKNKSRAERFADLGGSMAPHPKHGAAIAGRHVIVVDDVMTSGATLAAATEAAKKAGAAQVDMVTLARVAKDA